MMPRKPALTPNSKGRVRFVAVSRSISPFGLIGFDSSLKGGGASLVCPTAARARLRRRSSPPMSGEDDVADEGDWYAALVAGEHVGDWLDTVRDPARSAGRRERAARSLAAKVSSDGTCTRTRLARRTPRRRSSRRSRTSPRRHARRRGGCSRGVSLRRRRRDGSRVRLRRRARSRPRDLARQRRRRAPVESRRHARSRPRPTPRVVRRRARPRARRGCRARGLLAAKLGARTVVLTDSSILLDSSSPPPATMNAADVRPGPDAPVRVARCDGREEPADALGADAQCRPGCRRRRGGTRRVEPPTPPGGNLPLISAATPPTRRCTRRPSRPW